MVDCPNCGDPCDVETNGPVTVFKCQDCGEPESFLGLLREMFSPGS